MSMPKMVVAISGSRAELLVRPVDVQENAVTWPKPDRAACGICPNFPLRMSTLRRDSVSNDFRFELRNIDNLMTPIFTGRLLWNPG